LHSGPQIIRVMADAQTRLLAFLEQSQTQKDVDPHALRAHLEPVEVLLSQQPAIGPQALQRLVSVLCSWLRAHEDFPDGVCMTLIFRLLGRLLGQDAAADGIAIQKGLLSTCTVLIERHAAEATMVRALLEVLAMLSIAESSDSILNRLGTVPIIVKLLRRYRENGEILEDVVTTLALMAKRTRHRRTLSQGESITELVDVLKRGAGRPSLVVAVCRFLSNFAVKEECCLTVLHHGGVDALMAAFNNSVQLQGNHLNGAAGAAEAAMDTRAEVAKAIWVCSTDCQEVQNALLSSGWLPDLAAVLQGNPNHGGLHQAALGIVRGLSRNKQYREDIVGLGLVEATVDAMQRFPGDAMLVKEGCGVLGNLATDPEIRVQLGECGVLQVILVVLGGCKTHNDRKVAKLALGALLNLASCEPNRDILAGTEVVTILLDVTRTFLQNENILEYAIGALSHLAVQESCNRQLASGGAIQALLLFLDEHREDLQVVSKSLVALRRLLKFGLARGREEGQEVLRQISAAGSQGASRGMQLVVSAMQEHVYDESVVREAALLLTAIGSAGGAGEVNSLMQLAAKPCMKALELHNSEPTVSDALAGLLAAMPLE